MRLQSGILVVSIAVVSIAVVSIVVVSIAELHHVMRLQCWVGLKQKLSFSYLREVFISFSQKKTYKNFLFSRKFSRKYFIQNEDPDS
jgi:hypothetical protein